MSENSFLSNFILHFSKIEGITYPWCSQIMTLLSICQSKTEIPQVDRSILFLWLHMTLWFEKDLNLRLFLTFHHNKIQCLWYSRNDIPAMFQSKRVKKLRERRKLIISGYWNWWSVYRFLWEASNRWKETCQEATY